MLSGALIKLPEELDINLLNGLKWEREWGDRSLKSVIQFQEGGTITLRDMTINTALAINEDPAKQPIIDDYQGRYSVSFIDTINVIWSNIYIISGLVVVDSISNRSFVRETINKGLKLTNTAHDVALNTAQMARDHADQWVRAFSDRRGRVDRGTLYGDGIEQDAVFAPEFGRSTSKAIGWITNFFGSPMKVRVSPRGSVTLWAWPPPELFLRFIKTEILPYMISL